MDRSLRLAALASAAVPGLDPIAVQEVVGGADEHFDVAFIQDTQQRRWVIRAPRSEVAAAHMDASLAMLALLVRRVPFAVPAAKGFAPIPKIGRAAVHSYIPGYPLDLAALHPAHPVTAELGRTIAMIHNVDRALYDEAGLASYDAESYRRRHLAEIDRGAATGRVPAGLLARWEESLDDVRLWRFAPTPIHGALSGSDVLVTFPDRADAARATIRGVTGWEAAKVADPADDFAALVTDARSEVVDAVLRAYAHVRVERPDEHIVARARLVSELALLATLLRAVGARDEVATEATTARLRRLDDTVHSEVHARRFRIVPAPPVSLGAAAPGGTERPVVAGRSASWSRQHPTAPGTAAEVTDAVAAEISPDGAEHGEVSEPKGSPASPDADATDVIDVIPSPSEAASGTDASDEGDDTDDRGDEGKDHEAGDGGEDDCGDGDGSLGARGDGNGSLSDVSDGDVSDGDELGLDQVGSTTDPGGAGPGSSLKPDTVLGGDSAPDTDTDTDGGDRVENGDDVRL